MENFLEEWIKTEASGQGLMKYASAISVGVHVKEDNMDPTYIYYNSDDFTFEIQYSEHKRGGYRPKLTKILDNTNHLGFMYQEWSVNFAVSAGELTFEELSDA